MNLDFFVFGRLGRQGSINNICSFANVSCFFNIFIGKKNNKKVSVLIKVSTLKWKLILCARALPYFLLYLELEYKTLVSVVRQFRNI